MSQPSTLCVTCGYPLPEIRCPECGAAPEQADASERARAALNATLPAAIAINAIVAATIAEGAVRGLLLSRSSDRFLITQWVTLLLWGAMLPALTLAAPRGPARRIWLLTAPLAVLGWVVPSFISNLIWLDYTAEWLQIMMLGIALGGIPLMTSVAFALLHRTQRSLLRAVGVPEPPAYRALRLIAIAPALVLLAMVACSLPDW